MYRATVRSRGTRFSYYSREVGILYYGGYYNGRSLYFAFNFHWDAHEFFLPNVEMGETWKVLIDTAGQPEGLEIQKKYEMQPRSITIFESVRKPRKRKRDAGKQHPVND